MKLTDIYNQDKTILSFEIFPPKAESELKNIDETLEMLCDLHPDYISVTFGAGGSSNNNSGGNSNSGETNNGGDSSGNGGSSDGSGGGSSSNIGGDEAYMDDDLSGSTVD